MIVKAALGAVAAKARNVRDPVKGARSGVGLLTAEAAVPAENRSAMTADDR